MHFSLGYCWTLPVGFGVGCGVVSLSRTIVPKQASLVRYVSVLRLYRRTSTNNPADPTALFHCGRGYMFRSVFRFHYFSSYGFETTFHNFCFQNSLQTKRTLLRVCHHSIVSFLSLYVLTRCKSRDIRYVSPSSIVEYRGCTFSGRFWPSCFA